MPLVGDIWRLGRLNVKMLMIASSSTDTQECEDRHLPETVCRLAKLPVVLAVGGRHRIFAAKLFVGKYQSRIRLWWEKMMCIGKDTSSRQMGESEGGCLKETKR